MSKVVSLIGKIFWTLVAVLILYFCVLGIIQGDYEGIDIYIIFFHLYMLIKFWFKRVNLEDAILITLLESVLCIRYMIVNILDITDIFVVATQILPVSLAWTCFYYEGEGKRWLK